MGKNYEGGSMRDEKSREQSQKGSGRHGFAGANEPLGRVSRTAESSLKEASLAEASEFKVPTNRGKGRK
jgi:hypothetical protein